jgi:tRNA (cmo5U34)-methyltransferase
LALPLFPGTRFLLVDPSAPMIGQARQRLCDVDGNRIEFLRPAGSADLAAQLAPNSCQVVTSILCHHYLRAPEHAEAVRACYRLLAPEGLFVTFENVMPRTDAGVRIGLERWGRFQVASGRSTETVSAHLERFDRNYFPLTLDEHFALMHEIGFRTVEIFWLSHVQAGFYAIK